MVKTDNEAALALQRGRTDIALFSRDVLGIEPNLAQLRWYRYINPGEKGWEWRYKVVIHVAANQIGKTIGVAVLILWACNYKIGIAPPDPDDKSVRDWISRPYPWFHLAPTQQQAYLPLSDILLIVQGAHPAQEKGKALGLKCRWVTGLVNQTKIEQYYDGLTFWNGSICQFRTTDDKAKALQGRRAAGISYDEAAFEDNLKAVVEETLMMRLIAMDGPLLMVGTPNGINDYYEYVEQITQHGEERAWNGLPTEETPEERVWVNGLGVVCWSVAQDNVGWGLTQDAVDLMEERLDEATKEQQLRGAFLEPAEAFFTPVQQALAAFRKKDRKGRDIPELEGPIPGHRYVVSWDPSVASDPTACVVFDITEQPWRGVAIKHHKKPLGVTELINEMWAIHALYNGQVDKLGRKSQAITVYDGTAMGGQIVKQLLAGMVPSKSINFGGPTAKVQMLTNLRAALINGKLILPDQWANARRELANYRLKDDKIPQDIVMALAMAAEQASRGFAGSDPRPFSPHGRVTVPIWR